LNLLIMGPPGAGKNTQAEALVKKLNITHISTGELLRQAIMEGAEPGKKAKEYMDKGELAPDVVVIDMVREYLSGMNRQNGFLMDGFPRTLPQAVALDEIMNSLDMKLHGVINIAVPKEKLVARLTGRRVCHDCGASYNLLFNPPARMGTCDVCTGELYQRSDDHEEAVARRIDIYEAQTQPLISYYQEKNLLININGDQDINQVINDILTILSKNCNPDGCRGRASNKGYEAVNKP